MRDYPNIFRAIRSDARQWWYHSQLRRQGQVDEARKREHQSIASTVSHLRNAMANGGFVTISARGGCVITVGRTGMYSSQSVEGVHPGNEYAARKLLPTVRFDLASYADARRVAIRGPMLVADNEIAQSEGFGSFDKVRFSDAVEWLRTKGIPVDMPPWLPGCDHLPRTYGDVRFCDKCGVTLPK